MSRLEKEHNFQACENCILRRIFRPKTEKGTGGLRK
jgi:hypothetical protein